MLLDDLYSLVKHGSEMPLAFWMDDLKAKKDAISSGLRKVASQLEEDSEVQKKINDLIVVLNQDEPDESSLAQDLLFIPGLFQDSAFAKYAGLIADYGRYAQEFLHYASSNVAFRQAREEQKARLTIEQQKAQDLELFRQGGMFYCLEYYLALYRKMLDTPTEEEKRRYIEADVIKADIADLPGLWIDFRRNEVLEKFIYLILDDAVRNNLMRAYFATKTVFMDIERHCDDQGHCEFKYDKTTLPQASKALRRLILAMIQSFQAMGIERLGSKFLTPYGDQPLLEVLMKAI